ncbi:hypothetical protein EJ110_NYTH45222 [Nymphaea thermarum]|nr:hypothetical protein EJ110_NYTH45222 [Nymphaea thermarum]
MHDGSVPTLGTSKNLKVLILSRNCLFEVVPNLSGLINLKVLDLGDNLLGPKFPALGNRLVALGNKLICWDNFAAIVFLTINSISELKQKQPHLSISRAHEMPSFNLLIYLTIF